ncbi:S1C family serine protease [Kitasatospora kifunensis]|uniref:PDZ domain-containing protein n=1 Tax=Kitasatospora kifunensis TaxID=58351 RepID=A0A7W7R7G9_KITKI|nr:PDZ domain-containing protein [Kitasatospora kifunensis]MBB4926528.1 hypothetical protein [Kitasatospora kifunensis]
MRRSVRSWTILGVGACTLLAGALPAAATAPGTAHTAATRAPARLQPQENIPELDAPGGPESVEYGPDYVTRPSQGTFSVTAPQYTRITAVDFDCPPCTEVIASDGSAATVRTPQGRWRFGTPIRIWLKADPNAPLAGGRYQGTFRLDSDQQPLVADITEGEQGILGVQPEDNPGGGGARVRSVTPDSPADNAGIRVGDVITSFNNTPVNNAADLRNARIGKVRSGAVVPVTYKRPNGSSRTVQVTLD